MMKIPYIEPVRSPADVAKAEALVTGMQQLVQLLNKSRADADNRFTLLSRENRAFLKKQGYPAQLVNNVAFYTEQVRVKRDEGFVDEILQMVGFTSHAFSSDLYASPAIKDTLIESHSGRCAYCETLLNQSSYGDVEHFRPKAAYTTPWSPAMFRPGYFQLAYQPQNLFLSCQLCNEAYKQNRFEVLGSRMPEVPEQQEMPLLVNPYQEDPRDFLRFNPVNGRAYAFDLAAAFYLQTQGWSPAQTAAEIWKDPSRIPAQQDLHGISLTDPAVDAGYARWLAQVRSPILRRGTVTMNTLGLNRPALVRARADHLRQLRAMVWTASSTGADAGAAQSLLAALKSGDPGAARIAPQYLSLSVDAIQTWTVQGKGSTAWIEAYNDILQAFVPPRVLLAPTPHNDALSYLLLESELSLAGQRRLVYISSSDVVYGNPRGQKAVFLAVDWDLELDNTVLVNRDGKTRAKMTLLELVEQLSGSPSAYNLFRRNELWVLGDFEPFRY